ncbi:MAG TPA: type II secretion system major pseudopilin GspG [Candidatus Binatia bacterium]|nr:type II secretion system major pseudopilin GspG [Candidatus Binatia bacterium]
MQPRPAEAGFTLIEIMVVVFILGLLVTLVAPKIIGRTDDARKVKAAADIKGIESALQMFKLDCGFYPSTGQGIDVLVGGSGGGGAQGCRKYNPEGYLDRVPLDPWGNRYAYFSDGQHIIIKSYGADGQEGGEGKNADIDSRALD